MPSTEGFFEHFNETIANVSKEVLVSLVKQNAKKMKLKLKDVKSALTTWIREETDISEVIEAVKQRVRDDKLPDIEVVRILWNVIMDAVQWSRTNHQQGANLALRQVKIWSKLLNAFCISVKLELEMIYKVQMRCYGDAKAGCPCQRHQHLLVPLRNEPKGQALEPYRELACRVSKEEDEKQQLKVGWNPCLM